MLWKVVKVNLKFWSGILVLSENQENYLSTDIEIIVSILLALIYNWLCDFYLKSDSLTLIWIYFLNTQWAWIMFYQYLLKNTSSGFTIIFKKIVITLSQEMLTMLTVFYRELLCLFKDHFLGKIFVWKTLILNTQVNLLLWQCNWSKWIRLHNKCDKFWFQ